MNVFECCIGSLWMNVVKQIKNWIPQRNCKGPLHKVRGQKLVAIYARPPVNINIIL